MSCIISEEGGQRKRERIRVRRMRDALQRCSSGHRFSTLLWISSAMNELSVKAIDCRLMAMRNRKWTQSATTWLVSPKCAAERNFDCRKVRLYRGGLGAGRNCDLSPGTGAAPYLRYAAA
jgi:hypothetical protein